MGSVGDDGGRDNDFIESFHLSFGGIGLPESCGIAQ